MDNNLENFFEIFGDQIDKIAKQMSHDSIFGNIDREIKRKEKEELYKRTKIIDVKAIEVIPEERRLK